MNQQDSPVVAVAEPVGHEGARVAVQERQPIMVSGWLAVVVLLGCVAATLVAVNGHADGWAALASVVFVLVVTTLVVVPPGQSRVVQYFGSYVGSVRRPGPWSVFPLTVKRAVSIRVRNFETNRLKVNDADG
ncbi:MAG: SPFH domain-containing protein, partial [Gemmataceae bacterium]